MTMPETPGDPLTALFDKRVPTDKELAAALPALSQADRIEALIRKYVGGAMSAYDGERSSFDADAQIAKYLVRKIKPWLSQAELQGQIVTLTQQNADAHKQWLAEFRSEVQDKLGVVFNGCNGTPLQRSVNRRQCEDFLVEMVAAKLARLAAVETPPPQWQPIETAPKDGSEVLVWTLGGMETQMHLHIASYGESAGWRGWTSVDGFVTSPTHWMPLPAPPVVVSRLGGQQDEEKNKDLDTRVEPGYAGADTAGSIASRNELSPSLPSGRNDG